MIKKYLPKKEDGTERKLIQATVPESVAIEARKIKDQLKLSWDEVLEACLKNFIEELKGKKYE